jgi:DNA-binding LacI/PurR family transcriptional regulator
MNADSLNRKPLHCQIADRLRAEILGSGKPGDRLDAESRMAQRFGVSTRTIREALSALAQDGLLERRHGSGTYVAARNESQHIALWYGIDCVWPRSTYGQRVLGQLHSLLVARGARVKTYTVCIAPEGFSSDEGYKELLDDLSKHRVGAIGIVQGTFGIEALDLARRTAVPLVWNTIHTPDTYGVGEDSHRLIRDGTRYLLEHGCRRIAWLQWMDARDHSDQQSKAIELFSGLMDESGATFRREWIRGHLHPSQPGAGYEEFREIWTCANEKPDGLLVTDDVLFQDVATAILELGVRVPQQLRVVAHANKGMVTCPFFPAARMECDPEARARVTAELLWKLARRESVDRPRVELPIRWVEPPATESAELSHLEVKA